LDLSEVNPLHDLRPPEKDRPPAPERSSIPDQDGLLVVMQPMHDHFGLDDPQRDLAPTDRCLGRE
jgi:hypothetical protein